MKRRGFIAAALTLLSALGIALFLGSASGGGQGAQQRARFVLDRNAAAPGRMEHGRKPPLYHEAGGSAESAAAQAYADQAYPATRIAYQQVKRAHGAAARIQAKSGGRKPKGCDTCWQAAGPDTLNVGPLGTQTYGPATQWSGRVTALAVGKPCKKSGKCTLFLGAAGGGVWKTTDASAKKQNWVNVSDGQLDTSAIGSIVVDPTDPSGKTIYVGTGEPNGSSDSEDGVGLYKSTDGGATWSLIEGSVPYTASRSIGAIAVDPNNSDHLLIGTDVARHGFSSNTGGRFTPPGAPTIGLYESTNGGDTWTLVFNQPQDPVDPTSPNGSDFFRAGVTKIQFDPGNSSIYYLSMTGYGVYRYNGEFEQIFTDTESDLGADQDVVRFEFKAVDVSNEPLAPKPQSKGRVQATCTLLYVGAGWNEGGPNDGSQLYGFSCANAAPASEMTAGANEGWASLSSTDDTDPRFGSFDFCQAQCSYDMFVESPLGRPNEVVLGGSMQYGELPLYSGNDISNGRAVVMSQDFGYSWTDVTGDATRRKGGYLFSYETLHPDQHAIAFNPENPDIMFIGNDGGVERTDGKWADNSADCSNDFRGLSGQDLANCQQFLSKIPKTLIPMNAGLPTLQFQNLAVDPHNPLKNLLGGTQDNGTLAYNGDKKNAWYLGITGDGGDSGIDFGNGKVVFHTYTGTQTDTNFRGPFAPESWVWTGDPMFFSGEAQAFYAPMLSDPVQPGRVFAGMENVWRTNDNGGDQSFLENHCNTTFLFGTSDLAFTGACGDWTQLGTRPLNSEDYGVDKNDPDPTANYVIAFGRPTGTNRSVLWAGTRRGRVFISKNANAGDPEAVQFFRVDNSEEVPTRLPSGIFVDPADPYHAWVTFSGYNAYADAAGTAEGHIFEVQVNPNDCSDTSCAATWTNLDYDIGDQPVLDIQYDEATGALYISTDFGVFKLDDGATSWIEAASGLPTMAIVGLKLQSMTGGGRVLYAITHGRGAYRLLLPAVQ